MYGPGAPFPRGSYRPFDTYDRMRAMKEYTISLEDYIASQKLYIGRRLIMSMITGTLTAAVLMSFVFLSKLDMGLKLRFGVPTTLFFAVLIFAKPFWLKRRLTRAFHLHRTLQISVHISFDDKGITFASERGYSRAKWEDFEYYKENEALFLILEPNLIMRILPKRAFESEAEIDSFRSLLSAHLKKK